MCEDDNVIAARNAVVISVKAIDKIAAKKVLCILLYAMVKGSYRMMERILKIDHTLVYRWIRKFGENLPEPEVSGEITQMKFDEMWHFIDSKKKILGYQSH